MIAIGKTILIVARGVKAPNISGNTYASRYGGGAGRGKREGLEGGAVGAGRDETLEIQESLGGTDLRRRRAGRGMSRREERAAIGVRLDRNLERGDSLRRRRDLELVHADEGSQDRQRRGLVDACDVFQGLRGDLAEALAGDQRQRAGTAGELLRNAEH